VRYGRSGVDEALVADRVGDASPGRLFGGGKGVWGVGGSVEVE
jgi:hypothetical protein